MRNALVGIGYDVHSFKEGRPLVLGGVCIEESQLGGLEGHSDADVLAHALADALLGAAGKPDIGCLFPNTDRSVRGISSLEILRRVSTLLRAEGLIVCNIDCTVIAETPKVAPHAHAIKEKLAGVLDIKPPRVGIKATTNERMGFLGRKEGIAALAIASLVYFQGELPCPSEREGI
ncbi:MAG: 2-C-methyl-D-erythritol 2,4-cyclodiphosphate synthase [Candidatus Xiphinematobacter sp.]|nr:MAG: 2-C-methyl-D-erythritol 2,4-cyclodiphosphate synthase [Candidatus Xiphinematobacter sp.]QQY09350.1 MAG: 2-C-methyl-D-erythritol 2,4-cyclodiphosphate synthase [Candidatus Xiphinematobacter sp.]QQY10100.1 MAG: 2-C-methyl-D-erythritol 2,4-cyclodiphosphate synthase [Candidatus Xiphinematobacter sp.]QQY11579.1 MAG: 2-C-methyl-D-erythritol 2,4-cyclodiphosphate synthase [Candidatus Xiphinematobacter sp.]